MPDRSEETAGARAEAAEAAASAAGGAAPPKIKRTRSRLPKRFRATLASTAEGTQASDVPPMDASNAAAAEQQPCTSAASTPASAAIAPCRTHSRTSARALLSRNLPLPPESIRALAARGRCPLPMASTVAAHYAIPNLAQQRLAPLPPFGSPPARQRLPLGSPNDPFSAQPPPPPPLPPGPPPRRRDESAPPPELAGGTMLALVRAQIEYYFSEANLETDAFLREQMDPDGGWVDLALVARFNRVRSICADVSCIASALHGSERVVLAAGPDGSYAVRCGADWRRWVAPNCAHERPSPPAPLSALSSCAGSELDACGEDDEAQSSGTPSMCSMWSMSSTVLAAGRNPADGTTVGGRELSVSAAPADVAAGEAPDSPRSTRSSECSFAPEPCEQQTSSSSEESSSTRSEGGCEGAPPASEAGWSTVAPRGRHSAPTARAELACGRSSRPARAEAITPPAAAAPTREQGAAAAATPPSVEPPAAAGRAPCGGAEARGECAEEPISSGSPDAPFSASELWLLKRIAAIEDGGCRGAAAQLPFAVDTTVMSKVTVVAAWSLLLALSAATTASSVCGAASEASCQRSRDGAPLSFSPEVVLSSLMSAACC